MNNAFANLMREKGLSILDVALGGVPYGTVKSHYYGVRQISLTSAKKYAKIFDLPLSTFFDALSKDADPAAEPDSEARNG